MGTRTDLGTLYRGCRERIGALVLDAAPEQLDLPVITCPGWSVHDVVAHLVGVVEDGLAGALPAEGPVPEWTASHVERRRGVPIADVIADWDELGPQMEEVLRSAPLMAAVFDVASHEHDVRTALGQPGTRDDPAVRWAAGKLIRSLEVPQPLVVRTEDDEVAVGPPAEGEQPTVLTTTRFEAFRWRLGRRSRAQLEAMDWSGDPAPFLDHLCVFGPADDDVAE